MFRTTLHRTLTATALALLVLGAPAAVLAAPGPPGAAVTTLARLWLEELRSWIGGPAGGRPAAGAGARRGSGLQALPQADGSYIDPNGGKLPVPPPPPQ